MTGPQQFKRDQGGRFSTFNEARQTAEEHPGAATAVALGGGLLAARGVRVGGMARTARALKDTERAGKLAHDLAPLRTAPMPDQVLMDLSAVFRQMRDPAQKNVYRAAVGQNKDVARLRAPFDDWSRKIPRATKIREAANDAEQLRGLGVLKNPGKAERQLQARIFTRLIDAADPKDQPQLFRVMHMPEGHKVGDVVDFGRVSSWTTNRKVTEQISQGHAMAAFGEEMIPKGLRGVQGKLGTRSGNVANTYVLPKGTAKAANLSGASKQFRQDEWLTGGRYKVSAVNPDGSYRMSVVKSAFDREVSKKGAIRAGRQAVRNAERVSADAAEITDKVKHLIPTGRKAAAIGAASAAGLGAATGGATYLGARQGTRAGMKPPKERVGKSSGPLNLDELDKSAGGVVRSLREGVHQGGGRVVVKPNVKVAGGTKAERAAARVGYASKDAAKVGAGIAVGGGAVEARRRLQKAFDSERNRHRRADAASGVAAGGAVVAGDRARRTFQNARNTAQGARQSQADSAAAYGKMTERADTLKRTSGAAQGAVVNAIGRDAHKGAGKLATAQREFKAARKLGARGAAYGAGAAGLAGAAAAVQHHDKRGGGKTYSYR